MSIPVEVPREVYAKAAMRLLDLSFKDMVEHIIKGPCSHIPIEPGCEFEMYPISMESHSRGMCKFTFAITHECEDDRTHWVNDRLISITVKLTSKHISIEVPE